MDANLHLRNFRQYHPLNRLNHGIAGLDIFNKDASRPLQITNRQKKFESCMKSFMWNLVRLHRLLDSISSILNISYNSKDRKQPYQHQVVRRTIELGNDLFLFFVVMKVLLDDMAFFVPFYFPDSLKYGKNKIDLRDKPISFSQLKEYFLRNVSLDEGFVNILRKNDEWIQEISDIRNFLIHRFHDLSLHNDYCWTNSYYVFFYEFNELKNYIPDIVTYLAKMYFSFVKFTYEYEKHFKKMCEIRFPNYKYFDIGHATANGLGKTHLYFAGLGKLLSNKIIIRIHPGRRTRISKILEYFMKEENIVCNKCARFEIRIKPTIENYISISSYCGCGNPLPIPLRVERKFFPHFMDQNQDHIINSLIPYESKIKILTL